MERGGVGGAGKGMMKKNHKLEAAQMSFSSDGEGTGTLPTNEQMESLIAVQPLSRSFPFYCPL